MQNSLYGSCPHLPVLVLLTEQYIGSKQSSPAYKITETGVPSAAEPQRIVLPNMQHGSSRFYGF